MDQTEFLEGRASKVDTVVTGNTAVVHERAHAFSFLFAQGVDVAFEVFVPFGRRQQGTLKRTQCGSDVFKRNRAVFRESFFKHFLIFGNFGDFGCSRLLRIIRHFHRIHQRPARLFFNVSRTAVPKLAAQQRGIQCGRRVAFAKLPFVSLTGRHIVHTGGSKVVARVAAHGIAFGKARFIPELVSEFDLFFGKRTDFLHFFDSRQRLEYALRAFQKVLVFGRGR